MALKTRTFNLYLLSFLNQTKYLLLLLTTLLCIHITERKWVFLQACRLAHLWVGLSNG